MLYAEFIRAPVSPSIVAATHHVTPLVYSHQDLATNYNRLMPALARARIKPSKIVPNKLSSSHLISYRRKGDQMAGERLNDALRSFRKRYARASSREEKKELLDPFCRLSGYSRKYAISLLNRPHEDEEDKPRLRRGSSYSDASLKLIEEIWNSSGYPWSVRLKAMLPIWIPWARGRFKWLTEEIEKEALSISARQIDRRLAEKKRRLKRRMYGRTKPGSLLNQQIPIRAEAWEVDRAGYVEIDLVSHSGPSASGEFAWTLNLTDIHTGWCESRAVLGRGQEGVVEALDDIRRNLPFRLLAIDSDNGSEFINRHLVGYCAEQKIFFTRSRPRKKDDNAHVEQKNWTNVRRLLGWDRYDSSEVVALMNDFYRDELRLMTNLFQPSVKLKERFRVDGRLTRRYEPARAPLDRLIDSFEGQPLPEEVANLAALRERTNPFLLSKAIEDKLERIERVRVVPARYVVAAVSRRPSTLSPQGGRPAKSSSRKEFAHAKK